MRHTAVFISNEFYIHKGPVSRPALCQHGYSTSSKRIDYTRHLNGGRAIGSELANKAEEVEYVQQTPRGASFGSTICFYTATPKSKSKRRYKNKQLKTPAHCTPRPGSVNIHTRPYNPPSRLLI